MREDFSRLNVAERLGSVVAWLRVALKSPEPHLVDDELSVEERHLISGRVSRLRYISRQRQVEAPFWAFLVKTCCFAPLELGHDDLIPDDAEGRTYIEALHAVLNDEWDKVGPVGELPIHCCFLLAYGSAPGA